MTERHRVQRIITTTAELGRHLDTMTARTWEVASVSIDGANGFLVVLRRRRSALTGNDGAAS